MVYDVTLSSTWIILIKYSWCHETVRLQIKFDTIINNICMQ